MSLLHLPSHQRETFSFPRFHRATGRIAIPAIMVVLGIGLATADEPGPTGQAVLSDASAPSGASLPAELVPRAEAFLAAWRDQLGVLVTKYLHGLDTRLEQAADAANLPLATAFQEEKARVKEAWLAVLAGPVEDVVAVAREYLDLPALAVDAPQELVQLRQLWEKEREKIRADLDGKFAQSLQALEGELTRERRLQEARAVQAYRQSMAETVSVGAAASPSGQGVAMPATDSELLATKELPFENSLGMRLAPLPGTKVLFCIHETRLRDYATFAEENPDVDVAWKQMASPNVASMDRVDDHPVVRINWEDAQKFCEWLSRKEGRTYRLPTDEEWSLAVGLGRMERRSRNDTPADLSGKVRDVYPWGTEWPPPAGAGNYIQQSSRTRPPHEGAAFYLEKYDDGFSVTAPVMSFAPNRFGLDDMGGNAREWVEDWLDGQQERRVLRGGSWDTSEENLLRSSYRMHDRPMVRLADIGFRIVLEAR